MKNFAGGLSIIYFQKRQLTFGSLIIFFVIVIFINLKKKITFIE